MSQQEPSIARDWYHVSFDVLYPIIYGHRTAEAAQQEALFAVEHAGISPSDTVLDLCCGNGRHMVHLTKHAGKVVGLDYSTHLLALAQESLGENASLVRADMRDQPFAGAFDVVANFFTSFGYFDTEEENLSVLKGIASSLKPGGRFFMDLINKNWAEEHIEPKSVRHHQEYEISEDRWIDTERHRINKTMVVKRDGETVGELGESVQLYSLDDLTPLLTQAGLDVEQTFGDYSGTACCDPSQPRMIVVGRKA